MKKNGKLLALLLAVLMVATAFAGCTTGTPTTQQAQPAQPADAATEQSAAAEAGGKTITMMGPPDWIDGAFKKVISGYEEETGNKIELVSLPDDTYWSVVSTKIATNQLADINFIYSDRARLGQTNPETNWVDLTSEEFVPLIADGVASDSFLLYNDKIYSVPVGGIMTLGVFYNKDVFSKLGISVPTNYEEFLASCETLKANGIVPMFEGGQDGWEMEIFPSTLQAYVTAAQPDLFEKLNNNTVKLADVPELVQIFQLYKDLQTKGYMQEDVFSGTFEKQQEALATDKCGYVFNGSVLATQYFEVYPEAKDKLGFFVMPPQDGGKAIANGNVLGSFAINKNSANVNAALDFMRYFTRPDVLGQYYTDIGSIAPYKIDYKIDPVFDETLNVINTNGIQPAFTNALNPGIDTEGVKGLQELLADSVDAKGVLEKLDTYRATAGKDAGKEGW